MIPRKLLTMALIPAFHACSSPSSPQPARPVETVAVTPATFELRAGETRQLAAQPKDAEGNTLARTVTWQTGSAAVATVGTNGLVTAVAPGTTQITATSEGKSGGATVTVLPAAVATVTIAPASAELAIGQTRQLAATALDAGGGVLTGRAVVWASTNQAVATVSAAGLVTAVAPGTAQITATSEGKSGQASITVLAEPVGSVSIEPATAAIQVTGTVQLAATVRSAGGDVLTGRTIGWSSSAQAVATVNGSGLVTGVSPGTATITASVEGKSATATVTVSPQTGAMQVVTGYYHTCGLTGDGVAWCWGRNDKGQLGTGSTGPSSASAVRVSTSLRFQAMAVSWASTCGLTPNGQVWCWGDGEWGALGNGSFVSSLVPVQVAGGRTFVAITGGDDGMCALTTQQDAYCWGDGDEGQLGNGGTIASAVPVLVGGGHKWQSIESGSLAVCGLTVAGAAYCWGTGQEGELGAGSINTTSVPVPVGGGHVFAEITLGEWHGCGRTAAGAVWCWGWNGYGQLGNGTSINARTPVQVIGGDQFQSITASGWITCGLPISGQVKCWGSNEDGGLGNGTTISQAQPTPVSGGHTFRSLAKGLGYIICGTRTDNRTLCWGWNSYGQIGNGTFVDALQPVLIPDLPASSGAMMAAAGPSATVRAEPPPDRPSPFRGRGKGR